MTRSSAKTPPAASRRHGGHLTDWLYLRRLAIVFRRARLRDSERWLILTCAPLGAIVGLVVVVLHELVVWIHLGLFRGSPGEFPTIGGTEDQFRIIVVPAAGGLLLGLLTLLINRFKPRDIVDPVEANAIHGGRMSLTDSLRLALATLISNGGGASLGMEAAYSQMGSGVLSFIGRKLRLRRADQRIFVAAGAAAAIAAAFNAPLAGAFYAFELVLGSYSPGALAQVAMASLAGTLVVRGVLKGAPIFLTETPDVSLHRLDYPFFILLGLLAGLIGILAMYAVTWCETNLRKLPTPDWLRPMIGGAILSVLALTFPQVLGSGQDAISYYFDTTAPLIALAGLLAFKLIASAVSIGSGFRGGLFSTSLFMGALLGTLVAQVAGVALPSIADERLAFMLVGMGATAAAVGGAGLARAFRRDRLRHSGSHDLWLFLLDLAVPSAWPGDPGRP
jgi:CIC family chloride channel protein